MNQAIDRTGHRYGRWTVMFRVKNKDGRAQWLCQCDCGTRRVVRGNAFKRSKSCGCLTVDRAKETQRAQPISETWTDDTTGWAVSQMALDWIRRPIRREAA